MENYKSRIKSDRDVAEKYLARKPDRDRAELGLIERGLAHINGVDTFLDAPCGVGRATILLAKHGYTTTGADLGEGAVEVARQEVAKSSLEATVEQANLEALHYADDQFDAVLCFRMFHHFPDDEIRRRVVAELCRVARRYVLISYLNPLSFTSIRRRITAGFGGKASRQITTRLPRLNEFFAEHDFQLTKAIPQQLFIHSLHLAVYEARP